MLDQIIDSTPKSGLTAFLAAAPERSYTAKELSARLRIPEIKLAKLLQEFSRLKLVKTFSKKGKRYYLANGKNKFFSDIRTALQKKRTKYDDELFAAVRKLGQVKAAYLSGIFTGQPQLPVDILIVGKVSGTKLDKFLADAKKMMGQEINHSIMTAAEFKVRYDTFDRFIKDIFDYPHLMIVDTIKASK